MKQQQKLTKRNMPFKTAAPIREANKTMPRFRIAVSNRETKCDTIWGATVGGEPIYLATDGTGPSRLEGPWQHYQLDIDAALKDGVRLDLSADNLGFCFEFPRPEMPDASRWAGMTGRMLLCLENLIRQERQDVSLTFPLIMGGRMYRAVGAPEAVDPAEL